MTKQIKFEWQDKPYVLEFTRGSIRQLEQSGFILSEAQQKPMTGLPALFAGAFLAHHKFAKKELIEEIYNFFGDKVDLFEKLGQMYNGAMESLMDEPDENDEKKIKWQASW